MLRILESVVCPMCKSPVQDGDDIPHFLADCTNCKWEGKPRRWRKETLYYWGYPESTKVWTEEDYINSGDRG